MSVTKRATPGWLVVMRWEMGRILRQKSFLVSLLLTPALAIGLPMLINLFGDRNTPKVAVVWTDAAGAIVDAGPRDLPKLARVEWVAPAAAERDTVALRGMVARNQVAVAILVPEDLSAGTVQVLVKRSTPRWFSGVEDALRGEARAGRAGRLGLGAGALEQLDAPVPTVVRTVVEAGSATGRRGDFVVVFAVLMLMMTVILSSISYLIAGIGGEKQARVTEVVVSAIPAQAWMDGKILAFTALGLIMGLTWAASLLVMAPMLAFALPSSLDPALFALTLAFAVLGLYLFNAMFAGLMATMRGMQSTQGSVGYFFMLPFLPLFFVGALIDNPDAAWLAVLSQLPPMAPSMIPVRMIFRAVTPWEIALALVLLVAGCWWARGAAGKLFRLGMLLYGKDMTMPEIARWVREK